MADTFTPRGAPVPSNSYDGWELTHRPAMLPFLAEYTNQQGETAGGWAMPNMVTEPVNALFRLMNTPAGTMPDPRDSQNQSDALTGLMALYGGNALGGVARNAMSRGIAMGRPNMEAARPVAYSNAIDEAMSNPNMLRMMDDIDYANLNRRALDQYGVGYEGLSSSQEAKLRGWSDPALWSDTGKPNPVGAAVAGNGQTVRAYHGSPRTDLTEINGGPRKPAYFAVGDETGRAKQYAEGYAGEEGRVYDAQIDPNGILDARTPEGRKALFDALDAYPNSPGGEAYYWMKDPMKGLPEGSLPPWGDPMVYNALSDAGYKGAYINERPDVVSLAMFSPQKVLSDTGKPNPVGAGVAGHLPMDEASRMARAREMGFDTSQVLYHGTGKDFDAFNPGTRGNGAVRNIYLTDNPEIADIYANSQNYGLRGGGSPMVYPVFAKAEKPLVVSDKGPDGSFGWVSDNLASALGVEHPPAGKYSSLYDEARRQGYDQVQIREMTDLGGNQTQYIPLEPKNIRSVNAAFDPAKADSSFLLASDTGRPNPLGAALTSDNQENSLMDILKKYGIR